MTQIAAPPLAFDSTSYDRSSKVFQFLNSQMSPWQEEVWVLALNGQLELIRAEMVFRGSADFCGVHPRDIFRLLIQTNAVAFILAHNHPSGNKLPSSADLRLTERIRRASVLMEILLVDHMIVTTKDYYSFAENKRLSGKRRRFPAGWPLDESDERR